MVAVGQASHNTNKCTLPTRHAKQIDFYLFIYLFILHVDSHDIIDFKGHTISSRDSDRLCRQVDVIRVEGQSISIDNIDFWSGNCRSTWKSREFDSQLMDRFR